MQCTFAGNTLFPSGNTLFGNTIFPGAAVIEASGSPQVRLEGCTFSNNTPSTLPTLLADNRNFDDYGEGKEAVFFSDSSSPSVCTYEGDDDYSTPPPCVDSSPLALEEAGSDFLNTTNEWSLEVQEVRPCCASLRKAFGVAHASSIAYHHRWSESVRVASVSVSIFLNILCVCCRTT